MKNLCHKQLTCLGLLLLLFTPLAANATGTDLIVKAKGSKADGIYAHFKVFVNDLECGGKFTTSSCKEYCFSVPFEVNEITEVKIVFDNDQYSMGEDRNLFVNCIFIGNEIPIKASKGTAKYLTKNGEDVEFGGMMGWDGELIFDITKIKMCPGNVTIASQSELNNFSCQYIDGGLTISGGDIVDLSPLSKLTSVKGALIIRDNPILTGIYGMNSVIEVDFLSIEDNPKLETVDGFNSLSKCGGMYIRENEALKTIKCFHSPDI
jgi:hypothetical protein